MPNQARTLTPRLDLMADQGVRVTSFYLCARNCTPARASLLTGCYATRVSMPNVINPTANRGLNTTEITLPEILKTQGYATGMVGKWHLGYAPGQLRSTQFLPTRQGFDQYLGIPYSNDMFQVENFLIEDDTMVLFTSDNGPWLSKSGVDLDDVAVGCAYPLRESKSTTLEGGPRVPCIARWPGMIPTGQVTDEIGGLIDLVPTLSKLAGTAPPADRVIDGKDLWPVLSGQPGATSPHSELYYYHGDTMHGVRQGPWKFRRPNASTRQLYHLDNDIQERTNEFDSEPAVAEDPDTLDSGAIVRCSSGIFQPVREVFAVAADNDTTPQIEASLVWPRIPSPRIASAGVLLHAEGLGTINAIENPAGTTYSWSSTAGPPGVVFTDPAAAATGVSFPLDGDYTIQLDVAYPAAGSDFASFNIRVGATPLSTPTATLRWSRAIDLNPVRAEMVDDPKDYRWCSYAEAVARKNRSRQGLQRVMFEAGAARTGELIAAEELVSWRKASHHYRQILYMAVNRDEANLDPSNAPQLTKADALLCKMRALIDGMALGTEPFIENIFGWCRELFSEGRKTGARKLRNIHTPLRALRALRDLRTDPPS